MESWDELARHLERLLRNMSQEGRERFRELILVMLGRDLATPAPDEHW